MHASALAGKKSKTGSAASEGAVADEEAEERPKRDVDPDREKRTLFVGNVPVDVQKEAFKKLFKQYGTVESVRFRSVVRAYIVVSSDEEGAGFVESRLGEDVMLCFICVWLPS